MDLAYGAYRQVVSEAYVLLLGKDRDFMPPASLDAADRDQLTGEHWSIPAARCRASITASWTSGRLTRRVP